MPQSTLPQIKVSGTSTEVTGITANGSAVMANNSRLRIIAEDPHDSGLSCSIFSAHHSDNSDEPVLNQQKTPQNPISPLANAEHDPKNIKRFRTFRDKKHEAKVRRKFNAASIDSSLDDDANSYNDRGRHHSSGQKFKQTQFLQIPPMANT